MRTRSIWWIGLSLLAGLLLGSVATPALAQTHFGIAAGEYGPEPDGFDNSETFAVRGGYRFRPNLGFEASLSRVDLRDKLDELILDFFFDQKVELTNLDLSVQWYPGNQFVLFGGPGVSRVDSQLDFAFFGGAFSLSDTAEVFTLHAGVGYDWQINDRFFIRPEARVRRYFGADPDEDEFKATYQGTDYEAGVMFGVRLGS